MHLLGNGMWIEFGYDILRTHWLMVTKDRSQGEKGFKEGRKERGFMPHSSFCCIMVTIQELGCD